MVKNAAYFYRKQKIRPLIFIIPHKKKAIPYKEAFPMALKDTIKEFKEFAVKGNVVDTWPLA